MLLNFSYYDLNEANAFKDLLQKTKMIKKSDNKIYIILVIRDA